MNIISIQCRLVASEPDRQQLWQLMASSHTPLVNTLLDQVAQHPEFLEWKTKGCLPAQKLEEIVKQTRQQEPFAGLPSRWITSAQRQVAEIYKSWLKRQEQLLRKLSGQQNWLAMLRSDEELAQTSGLTLEELKEKARELLEQDCSDWFAFHREAEDDLIRNAIAYLLKNGRRIPKHPEKPEKLAKKRRAVEIRIERLQIQLAAKSPSGRDMANDHYKNALVTGVSKLFETEEDFKQWQGQVTANIKNLPFPVEYTSNGDLSWSLDTQKRLCVKFNGLGKLTFKIYCDRQQLHLFQRFYEDQLIFKQNKADHSQALFMLRSATLLWKERNSKGEPWQANYLYLHCCIDTLLWSQEGTALIRQQKAEKTQQMLLKMKEKPELTPSQQQYLNRQKSLLRGLEGEYPRPVHRLYEGHGHLIVGVSLDIEQLASVALIDIQRGEILRSRSLKQLLGEDYELVHRFRYEKRHNAHHNKVSQQRGKQTSSQEAQLATHIDRLLAKAIISFAQENLAGSVALPKIRDIREVVQSQIQARAEERIPDSQELQRQYAKQYRINAHRWSYGRLLDAIRNRANKRGLVVEEGIHSLNNTAIEQAKGVALSAYALRNIA